MSETVLIAIPCRVITLQMKLGAEEGASTLEDLVLRAVSAGRNTVRELGDLFSLPNRLVLDVVHGLWSRGFLAVDFSTNTLEQTRTVTSGLGQGPWEGSAAPKVKTRKFLFDPVTAAVLLHRKGMDRIAGGAVAMPLARGISETDIPQTELLRAVREAVRTDRREHAERQRVLNVSFANPMLSPSEAVHWNTVEVVVSRDPVTDTVTVTPVQMPQGWGRRALQLFQARVNELVRNRPDSRFVRQLLSREVLQAAPQDSLRSLLVDLDRLAEDLSSVAPQALHDRHRELHGRATDVLDQLAEARRARCSVQSVAHGAGVQWVVKDLIEQATHQLVLALPRIAYDALHAFLPSLELAAKRGVTIVWLWGDTPSATLEGKVATALFDLQSRFPDSVMLGQRSSSSAASAVVRDDLCAYVGSTSPLSAYPGAGVLVKPVEGTDEPPSCVTDLLGWARRAYPYWQEGQNIALLPSDFGRRRGTDLPVDDGAAVHGVPLPELDGSWAEDEVAGTTRWAADWGRALRTLMEEVEKVYRGEPVVRAVWDGMYADLVQQSLDGATERLAVTDDSAKAETCTDTMGQRLSRLRDNGVVIHLQHPPLKDGRSIPRSYAEIHRRLGAEGTVRSTKARARAVLSDHETVMGSYRPLGNRLVNPVQGPAPTELGLHIMNTAFTADFAAELGIRNWFGATGDAGGAVGRPAYLPALPSLASAPVEADDWAVLDRRLASGAASPERLRADAAALLHGGTGSPDQRQRWGRRLLRDAWRRHAFMEAYLLAPRLGDAEYLPVHLAAAAVPVEHGPLGEQLYYSAMELVDAPGDRRTVALVGAVADMLLHGGETGLLVCDLLAGPGGEPADGVPPAWRELTRQAAACFAATRAPLPLEGLNAWAEQENRAVGVRDGWNRLALDVNDFKRSDQHFKHLSGKRLHRAMFTPPEGLFARVLAITDNGATAEFRSQTADGLPRTDHEARLYMNQLAGDEGLMKVEWGNHLPYARRVTHLLDEARRLAALATGGPGSGAQGSAAVALPVLTPEQRAFATLLDRTWHTLLEEADGLGEPARHPATALLTAFASLPVIGREDR
ncbi:hypothetical protein ACIBTP_20670 [Streptomyces avidinii]|uniref:hypothetical protein n=1 Tax=Streptomyces avidinii TaxID=1895 RepID=UPI0037A04C91